MLYKDTQFGLLFVDAIGITLVRGEILYEGPTAIFRGNGLLGPWCRGNDERVVGCLRKTGEWERGES